MGKDSIQQRKRTLPGSLVPKASPVQMTDFGFKNQETQKSNIDTLDQVYEKWSKQPNQTNLSELLNAANPVISKAITSFAGGDSTYKPRAKHLAIEAFRSYNPKKQAKLRTHLMIRLQALQREFTKRTLPVSMPERVQLDKLRMARAEQALTEELGREPSNEELADYTGLSVRRLDHIRKFASGVVSEGMMVSDTGESITPGVARVTASDIWTEFVHHDLDDKDKRIFEWKTGYNNAPLLSNNEIAKRLKMTPSAISQRAAKIAIKLEEGDK